MCNILISGVGGQGIVLASRLIAAAAIEKGLKARTAETIGMAQRGGCVVSHVRIGNAASPLIPHGEADVILAFEPAEAVRALPYLKNGGRMLVCTSPVGAVMSPAYDGTEAVEYLKGLDTELCLLDGKAVADACGSVKTLNLAMLAAASYCGLIPVSKEELETAVSKPPLNRFEKLNRSALSAGIANVTKVVK